MLVTLKAATSEANAILQLKKWALTLATWKNLNGADAPPHNLDFSLIDAAARTELT